MSFKEGRTDWVQLTLQSEPSKLDWMHSLEVEWLLNYDSTPDFKAQTVSDPLAFSDGPVWMKMGHNYYCKQDGCYQNHVHHGALSWDEEKQAWLTTQDEGYAGRHFPILMMLGQDERFTEGFNKVILRGPWHTGCPSGYSPLSTKPVGKDTCYCFGLKVDNRTIIQAFPLFFPDHTLHMVTTEYGKGDRIKKRSWLEPFKPGQEVPRTVMSERRCDIARARPKDFNREYQGLYRGHDGFVYMVVEENEFGLDIQRLDVMDTMATRRSISQAAIGRTFHKTDNRV